LPNADDLVGRTRADEQTEQRDAWSSLFPSSGEASGNKATSWDGVGVASPPSVAPTRSAEAGSVSKARRSGGGPPRAQPAPSHLARAEQGHQPDPNWTGSRRRSSTSSPVLDDDDVTTEGAKAET
ncbi:hypothetical protein THAOC_15202, partial [Thalassiosira oceanica]